jgi:hypothetical protein
LIRLHAQSYFSEREKNYPDFISPSRANSFSGSILISERGIYAASPFKAIGALKRAEARAPSAN